MGLQQRLRDGVSGRYGAGVLEEVAELGGVIVADRGSEADRPLADLLQALDLGDEDTKLACDLLLGRLAPEGLDHTPVGPVVLVDLLDHVDRNTYGPPFVGDGAGYGLSYPPRRVSRELVALRVVELLGRPNETEVALLDQIEKRDAAVAVLLGYRDHEPQISLHQTVLGPLAPAGYPLGEPYLVSVGEKRHPPYLGEIHPDRISRGDGVGDLDRRRLSDMNGSGYCGLAPASLAFHERYLFLLQRGVEFLYLRSRKIPLLQETGDLLRAEKALTSPPIQELVSALRQHHGILGRHLSPLLHLCASSTHGRTHKVTIVKSL